MSKKQKIVVALSGGGDKTFFYAGILYGLQEKYDIVAISVISGASYTTPMTINANNFAQAVSMATKFNPLDFVKEVPVDQILEKRGLLELTPRFYTYLKSLLGISKGINYKPKLFPIASYITGEYTDSISLHNIPFEKAVAASISLPFLFTPIKFKGRDLFDGAISGGVNTELFNNYKDIPTVIITSKTPKGSLLETLKSGLKYLNMSSTKLYYLKQLYDNEPVLRKVSRNIADTTATHGNFKINCDSLHNYGLLLNNNTKRKLFTLGFKSASEIYPQMDYYIATGRYKQLVNHDIDV